jgi:hypothetical protein
VLKDLNNVIHHFGLDIKQVQEILDAGVMNKKTISIPNAYDPRTVTAI